MSIGLHQATHLTRLEKDLIEHEEFGDWRNITNRLLSLYHGAIEMIGRNCSAAADLARAIEHTNSERVYRVLTDPTVRITIGRLLTKGSSSVQPDRRSVEVIETAARCLTNDGTPLASAALEPFELGNDSADPWVWTGTRNEQATASVFIESFESEISTSVSSQQAVLRLPTAEMRYSLIKGRELLGHLLPRATRSLMSHVHVVAVLDVEDQTKWDSDTRDDLCQNVSTHTIPGTIFISPSPLRNPWFAAEALLHESAHKKLSDIVMTGKVFRSSFRADESATITAVWNRDLSWNSNLWSADRALFALHYYAHAILFFQSVQEASTGLITEYGPLPWSNVATFAKSAALKACYLKNAINDIRTRELAEDGERLVDWLGAVIDDLGFVSDDSPNTVLLLERVAQETHEMKAALNKVPDSLSGIEIRLDSGSILTFQYCLLRLISAHMVAVLDEISAYYGEGGSDRFSVFGPDGMGHPTPLLGPLSRQVDLLVALRTIYHDLITGRLRKSSNGVPESVQRVVDSLSSQFEFTLSFMRALSVKSRSLREGIQAHG